MIIIIPLLQWILIALSEQLPLLKEVLQWIRQDKPLRALLVISVRTIGLLAVRGLLVFTLFFLAATLSAIVISLLVLSTATGGFLALLIIHGSTSSCHSYHFHRNDSGNYAVLVVTGLIGFFWTVRLATKKSIGVAEHSSAMTGLAI